MLKWRRRPSRSPRSRVHGGAGFPNSGTPCFTAWPAGSWDRGRAQNPDIRGHSRCIVRCANGPSARGRLHRRSVWRPRLWRGQGRVARLRRQHLAIEGYAFVWRIEAANSRWDTDSLVYYLLEGATATTLDLRALVEPAMKAKLPPKKRESNSFRVREDLPVKLDASGHARLAQCFMCRREKRASTYKVQIDIVRETRQAGGADCVDAAGQSGLSQASR